MKFPAPLRSAVFGASVLLPLSACTSHGVDAAVSSSRASIVGGAPDEAYPAVVTLFNYAANSDESTACSATVIAPHVVLTAAQCVFPDKSVSLLKSRIFIGGDSTNKKQVDNLGNWFVVRETRIHPSYNGGPVSGSDTGVVITEDELPVPPMRFRSAPLSLEMVKDQKVVVVGVGLTSGKDLTTSGIRTHSEAKVEYFSGKDRLGITAGVLCFGDVGGPVIGKFAGVDTLVGVNGLPNTQDCAGINEATRADLYSDYLIRVVEESDPGYLGGLGANEPRDAGGEASPSRTSSNLSSSAGAPASRCSMHLGAKGTRDGVGACCAIVVFAVLLARRRVSR